MAKLPSHAFQVLDRRQVKKNHSVTGGTFRFWLTLDEHLDCVLEPSVSASSLHPAAISGRRRSNSGHSQQYTPRVSGIELSARSFMPNTA